MNLFDIEDCDDSGAMQHAVERQTDRRALLSGAGLLAATIATPAGAIAADGDAELIRLGALLDAAWLEEDTLHAAAEDISEPFKRAHKIADQIELISATTLAGLVVKARAVSWCQNGDPFVGNDPATDTRLAASVFRDLLAIGGKPIPRVL